MTEGTNSVHELPAESARVAAQSSSESHPVLWSLRRELWENRSIVIAPLVIATMNLIGYAISSARLPERRRAVLKLDALHQRILIEKPYDLLAMMMMATALIVGIIYCLDALHGERRDRSILFWKSLPLSDRTAVLTKASVPLIVLPALSFITTIATQLMMFALSSAVLAASGLPATTSAQLPLFDDAVILLYGLVIIVLWHAPLYSYLLLVSAWARRAPLLWTVLPFMIIAALEAITMQKMRFLRFLQWRFSGGFARAFAFDPMSKDVAPVVTLDQLTPGRYFATPGMWLGVICAIAFLTAAIRLRRNREAV